MIEKNALEWLDMGEGLEKLDIYKKKKTLFIYNFFKILLKENNFPLFFYVILQSIYYFQFCCSIFPKDNDIDYSKDYLPYIFLYTSRIFLPQLAITSFDTYRIVMILFTILLVALIIGFLIIISQMNNNKQSYSNKIISMLLNIFLQILLNYLLGPIIITSLISFQCQDGYNKRLGIECLTKGNNVIYIFLSLINIILYSIIGVFFFIFYKEIGKIGTYTPKIQINTNFELYGGISKIILFIIYYLFNTFLKRKKIYYIIYQLIVIVILIIFAYYIYRNIYFYDKIMNILIHLGLYLTLWFSFVIFLKTVFNFERTSLFILFGWIIITVLTLILFNYKSSQLILNANIYEIKKLKDIEMSMNVLLEFIQHQEGTDKTILLGFYYRFREYLLSNQDMKEKYNFLSNATYLKKLYNNKSIINGYYILYLLYDYHLSRNLKDNLLSIHFCYFLINHLKNTVSAIYRCSKIKADSLFLYYYKYLLAENIKDYLVELNEANNTKDSLQNVQFSSLILYYLYQNLIRIKIADMAENQMNYYDYFKNFTTGSKSSLGFLKVGKKILRMREEIKKIWDKILILNPFCQEIKREYMSYIKEILNDESYYENELKHHNYIKNLYLPEKNDFYFKLFDNLNSAILLSEYNDNKILYATPNFKKIILLSNESNDLTINYLIPNNIEKFHHQLVNEALFYSNIEQIFTKQRNNIMIKTKNNTLLNTKIFIKQLPNLSYGLVFIIHIEKVLNNELKIVLDKDLKINGYSDEANSLKKENYENYGLIPSFLGTNICAVIPEILLSLTNVNNNVQNENNINKEIYLKSKIINQRGTIYKYNMPSPSKHIVDIINSIMNDIKQNGINTNDVMTKLKEKQILETKDHTILTENSAAINEGKNIGEKYADLIKEIEQNARISFKIEYEIIERTFLNGKYKYYLLTINKDIYNYEYEQENLSIKKKPNSRRTSKMANNFASGLKDGFIENTKKIEKEIKINNGKNISNDNFDKNRENLDDGQNIGFEQQKIIEEKTLGKIEAKGEEIKKIKDNILNHKLKTKYSIILLYLSIFSFIIFYIFLILNYLEGKTNLTNISNYLKQNLYYNETRICISHMMIIYINFILVKAKILKEFKYNDNSNIKIYKDYFIYSINNIYELTKKNNDFDDDYYKIFSSYSEIYLNNPFNDNYIIINMTNLQVIKLIISETLKFDYDLDNFLSSNEDDFNTKNSINKNIDNLTNYYLFFDFNGFNEKEIERKISKNFNNAPLILISACIIIIIILLLNSYIIYVLNYYETFFLIKIINLNSKEFEDYLKHFEELKYKLKNLENEQNTLDNEENIDDASRDNKNKLTYQYTNDNNDEIINDMINNNLRGAENKSNNENKENNNNLENNENNNEINNENNIENNNNNNGEDQNKKIKENLKKKKKPNKKDRVKKIKLIEQKNIKLKKMSRLVIIKNFLNALKICLSIILTITYYMIQTIYSNQKINKFIEFNNFLELIESVLTDSFITYFKLKKELFNYAIYYQNYEELIKNNTFENYTLNIQTNKNYSSPDFNNLLMELLKDFNSLDPGEVQTNIYDLYSDDGCKIIFNDDEKNYKECQKFWSGVISKGLQQTIIEMGSQFSILLSSFSTINDENYLDNILDNDIWKNFDYFMINYLYNSFQKSSDLFDELRIKYISKNEEVFNNIFYAYLVAYSVICLIFIYFVFSVIILFNDFLNFIAIIPVKILCEDRDINEELINLSKKLA